jgi:hypothetical protein
MVSSAASATQKTLWSSGFSPESAVRKMVEADVPDEERHEQADTMLDTGDALGGVVAPGMEQPGEHDARDEHVGERVPGRSPQREVAGYPG